MQRILTTYPAVIQASNDRHRSAVLDAARRFVYLVTRLTLMCDRVQVRSKEIFMSRWPACNRDARDAALPWVGLSPQGRCWPPRLHDLRLLSNVFTLPSSSFVAHAQHDRANELCCDNL